MARTLCIDFGRRRCGIAVTDILGISASGLPTVPTHALMDFLKDYCSREDVERIVMGHPTRLDGSPSESMQYITPFLRRLEREMPSMPVEMHDERFTSTLAHRAMIEAGLKKSTRQRKDLADKTAAVIILTSWLESRDFRNRLP